MSGTIMPGVFMQPDKPGVHGERRRKTKKELKESTT